MNDILLINTVRFYLRQTRRLTRAGPGPQVALSAPEEIAVWVYAERAAERLERLRAGASRAEAPARTHTGLTHH